MLAKIISFETFNNIQLLQTDPHDALRPTFERYKVKLIVINRQRSTKSLQTVRKAFGLQDLRGSATYGGHYLGMSRLARSRYSQPHSLRERSTVSIVATCIVLLSCFMLRKCEINNGLTCPF